MPAAQQCVSLLGAHEPLAQATMYGASGWCCKPQLASKAAAIGPTVSALLLSHAACPCALLPPCTPRHPKVVHCCGYDSIPADLGVLVAVDAARKQLNQ